MAAEAARAKSLEWIYVYVTRALQGPDNLDPIGFRDLPSEQLRFH